ncbi:glycerate kinase [Lapillicoccus sp.]|uniref:glycerate kinase n=1 Tax=Lapillicoccus sp. TaxID=1909287 RepID=UPI00260085EA|nr:glycerate kinase [Lapillicoccus sp.]
MLCVLLAPDKFKGTLTAAEVAGFVETGLSEVCRAAGLDLDVTTVPVADGGDGTLVAAGAAGFATVPVTASGPTGVPVDTAYVRRGDEAVVELAAVSALALLPDGMLAPTVATSRGTGDVIRAALDAGCRTIVVGIGGSASTDGGAGLVVALGARILDVAGHQTGDGGGALIDAVTLDLSGLHPALADPRMQIVVACDVDNPLCGPRGAAAVYGPQKGADADQVVQLDAGLAHWADLVAATTGADRRDDPGAGAAGGVGFAALAILGARLEAGVDLVFGLTGFHEALAGSDLVVTGEGSLDEQTLHGKAPAGVAAAAAALGIPVVAVAGRSLLTPERLRQAGIRAVYTLTELTDDRDEQLTRPGPLLTAIGRRIAREHLVPTASPPGHPGRRPVATATVVATSAAPATAIATDHRMVNP